MKNKPLQSREMSEEWNDVEINHLTDALESMRKKGHTLGLYGLNDQQATWIHKQHLPTKSIRQIKRFLTMLITLFYWYDLRF